MSNLFSQIKSSSLKRRLEGIEEHVKKELLRFWQVHAPHFTDHSTIHCENIVSNLDHIIPDEIKNAMDEYEAFLLLCGVWLHDIGMLVKEKGESLEHVREVHHEKGRLLIRTGLEDLDLIEDERFLIGEMTYYHRKGEDLGRVKETFSVQHDSTTSVVRLRFLCALIRLADGFDVAHSRSSRTLVDISGLSDESRFHHEAHLHVSGVSFNPISNEIVISLRVKDNEDLALLTNFLKSNLEKELLSVRDILKENGVDYSLVRCEGVIDRFAKKMPKIPAKVGELSIEQKLMEIERNTGYYSSMAIDEQKRVHIFYETISQTTRELQREVVDFLERVWSLFSDKEIVVLTLNKVHNPARTLGETDPEIITVVSSRRDFEDYRQGILGNRELWDKLAFFRKYAIDQFQKVKVKSKWSLAI